MDKEEDDEDDDEDDNEDDPVQERKKKFKYNRMYSSNIVYKEDHIKMNNIEEEEDEPKEVNPFFRFSYKKAATIGGSGSKINNLEVKLFSYQEEQKDNNIIVKTKQSKSFLNFIDINLFLQYIALGKKFFDSEEENNNLIEGFCLQYQTFIFPETLINKVISCFNYFYSIYANKDNQIIEEKMENEEEDNENENKENVIEKKDSFKIKEEDSLNQGVTVKIIPFPLIDFLYTLIKFHNIYNHNELSNTVIKKINDFLKNLNEINEIKDKYEQIIELSQIELKEYEASIIKFVPKKTIKTSDLVQQLSSSDDFSSDDNKLEKDENVPYKNKTSGSFRVKKMNQNKTFKFSTSKVLNKLIFSSKEDKPKDLHDDNKSDKQRKKGKIKKEEKGTKEEEKAKLYEFDILKYRAQDMASELTRVNYILFTKIKVKELLKGAFNGKDKYKSSPYICKIIKKFNSLSAWTIEEILAYDHAEKRAQILLKFIHICVILRKIGNFDDCLSIMTGITNSNINKLYKTWGHIPSADMANFRSLKKLLNFEDNWKNLRIEIEKRIEEKTFFIPYLGYFTKRLMFLEEMGPYIKKDTSLINLEKIVEVYKILKIFYKIKDVKNCRCYCQDENVKNDLKILQCLEPSNDDFLTETSNLLEPKFILANKKLNIKRRTKTDINFLNNINKVNIL